MGAPDRAFARVATGRLNRLPPDPAAAEHDATPAAQGLRVRAAPLADQAPSAGTGDASHAGILGAALGLALSMLPSLLPREPLVQGVLSAILLAVGYLVGSALGRLLGRGRARPGRVARGLAGAAVSGVLLVAVVRYLPWQNDLRASMGMPPAAWTAWLPIGLSAAVALCLGWAAAGAVRGFRRLTARRLGGVGSFAATAALVAALAVALVAALITATTSFSAERDLGTTSGTLQPPSPLRSGSPQSLAAWDSLGRKGRDFVAHGPTVDEIASFTGSAAKEPIRVYVGTASADTVQAQARLAVAELLRTGAFDRSVLVVAMPTGTGMVEPFAVDAVEYLHAGDTATVAVQYSARPSWLSVLLDRRAAQAAAAALFDAVYREWLSRPAAQRPALYLYGHSLGAEAFGPVVDRLAADDPPIGGALLAGPPSAWRSADYPPWVHVMRHPSDPVALFNPALAVLKPSWLGTQRPQQVPGAMRWLPFVTFMQVAADLPQAVFVPWGNGHMYSEVDYGTAWAALTGLAELEPAEQQRLLDQMRRDSSPVIGMLD